MQRIVLITVTEAGEIGSVWGDVAGGIAKIFSDGTLRALSTLKAVSKTSKCAIAGPAPRCRLRVHLRWKCSDKALTRAFGAGRPPSV